MDRGGPRASEDMGAAIGETQVAERDKRSLETEGSGDPDGEQSKGRLTSKAASV